MKQKEHLETGKANKKYDRLYRRGENGVKLEIYLMAIGHNIRKYHSQKKIKRKAVTFRKLLKIYLLVTTPPLFFYYSFRDTKNKNKNNI